MRGKDDQQGSIFSYVSAEERIPADHPLRAVRRLVDEVLRAMSKDFDALYADAGRHSIAPERLLRALLLQCFYSIRSERMLVEQISYSWLFRWFVGLDMDEPVWNHAVFSKNRERLLEADIARRFFALAQEQARPFASDEHFTVDGTLIEAWASQKSFQKKDASDRGDGSSFRGQRRRNDTHESRTDPEAKLYRKGGGQESRMSYLGHVLVENRNGLIVGAMATTADGFAERDAALLMVHERRRRRESIRTVGADKGYDSQDFVQTLRQMNVRPHVSQNNNGRRSAIDSRTTRHDSYAISQKKRPLIERTFGWMKTIAGIRKVKLRGLARVDWLFVLTAAAFNLWRIPRLRAAGA